MAGWSFDPFRGVTADLQNPSVYDVQRRNDLAKTLLGNKLPYEAHQSPLSAIADALAGTASAFEGSQASQEAQAGLGGANAALAQALSGGADPASLITAGGNPFLPSSESGLVGDLIKRKMGIGETFYGTPQVSFDSQNNPHYSIIGSLGTVKEIKPPSGAGDEFSIKNQLVDTPTAAGVAINPYNAAQVGTGVIKNNAQAESDKSYGGEVGKIIAAAPASLQKEGQLLQTLNQQSNLASGAIDQAIAKVQNGNFMTGVAGNLLSALPGTPQYDLAQTLQTIKANITIGTLNQMKANAPNGASGLGSVSNFEDELLGAINGSLAQGQSDGQLQQNLQKVKALLGQLVTDRNNAFSQDTLRLSQAPGAPPVIGGQGAPANAGAAASAPQQGNVVDYSTYFGGGQ